MKCHLKRLTCLKKRTRIFKALRRSPAYWTRCSEGSASCLLSAKTRQGPLKSYNNRKILSAETWKLTLVSTPKVQLWNQGRPKICLSKSPTETQVRFPLFKRSISSWKARRDSPRAILSWETALTLQSLPLLCLTTVLKCLLRILSMSLKSVNAWKLRLETSMTKSRTISETWLSHIHFPVLTPSKCPALSVMKRKMYAEAKPFIPHQVACLKLNSQVKFDYDRRNLLANN